MSTLEKTIDLLNVLPENQIEMIYNFVRFLNSQQIMERPLGTESLDDIFSKIVGVIPDTGKTLEEYREERIEYPEFSDYSMEQLKTDLERWLDGKILRPSKTRKEFIQLRNIKISSTVIPCRNMQ